MKHLDPKSLLIGILLSAVGFLSMGASNNKFKSLSTQELWITSEKGKPLMILRGDESGNGSLAVLNKEGSQTIDINHYTDGEPKITLHQKKMTISVELGQDEFGNGRILLVRNDGYAMKEITATN
jgi:hypothetical protein